MFTARAQSDVRIPDNVSVRLAGGGSAGQGPRDVGPARQAGGAGGSGGDEARAPDEADHEADQKEAGQGARGSAGVPGPAQAGGGPRGRDQGRSADAPLGARRDRELDGAGVGDVA